MGHGVPLNMAKKIKPQEDNLFEFTQAEEEAADELAEIEAGHKEADDAERPR